MSFRFVRTEPRHLVTLRGWFADPLARRWLGGVTDLERWFVYHDRNPGSSNWMVFADDVPVVSVGFEIFEPGAAAVGIVVAPEARRQGWGLRALNALATQPEAQGLHRLVGFVDPENKATLALVARAGYVETGADADGFLELSLVLAPSRRGAA